MVRKGEVKADYTVLSVIKHHWKNGNFNWPMIIYISIIHLGALYGMTRILSCQLSTLLMAFFLWPISGLGVTGGVHRLWSHRAYEAHWIVRLFFMICNSIANQGSIYHWCRDHRVHHKHSETVADPHNATRGFFFAHMGWLLVKKDPAVIAAGKELDFSDLEADPIVMFQKKTDPWFAFFTSFFIPGLIAQTMFGDLFWNGFWVAGILRYVIVLHFTWLVNSAAHFYGDHPYDPKIHPTENPFVAVAAMGEGWHNWHHKYPYDYAASEFGVGSQFNPTKLVIDTFAKLGLVWNRKRATNAWSRLKLKRMEEINKERLKSD